MKKKNTLLLPMSKQAGQHRRTKNPFSYLKQSVAVILSITSLNMAVAQSINKWVGPGFIDVVVNYPEIKVPEQVTINGSVKGEDGTALNNAKVKTVFGNEYYTDNNGHFSFTLKKEQVTVQNIFVSYDGLVTGIRSYSPVMNNADYDIVLYKPKECCISKINNNETLQPATLHFKPNKATLDDETKKQLDKITNLLKDHPKATLLLSAHTDTRKSTKQLADNRINAIKNYIIEQNGISTDRINIEKVDDKGNINTMDIKPQ